MLKEILKNRGIWVVISFILFSAFCFVEEGYSAQFFVYVHYALLVAVWASVVLYMYKKITVARKAAAGIFLKGVSYGNSD